MEPEPAHAAPCVPPPASASPQSPTPPDENADDNPFAALPEDG
jgi:hypothetical protein